MSTDRKKLTGAAYIGWTNYGQGEGWAPEPLKDRDTAIEWAMGQHLSEWVITPGMLSLGLVEPKPTGAIPLHPPGASGFQTNHPTAHPDTMVNDR